MYREIKSIATKATKTERVNAERLVKGLGKALLKNKFVDTIEGVKPVIYDRVRKEFIYECSEGRFHLKFGNFWSKFEVLDDYTLMLNNTKTESFHSIVHDYNKKMVKTFNANASTIEINLETGIYMKTGSLSYLIEF